LWVREKIGRSISGWRSYGAWAYAPGGAEDTYLLDDAHRFLANADARDGAVPASESLKRFCELLRLGKDGTEASRACKPDDGDNQMNQRDEDIAHPGMVSKPEKTPNFGPIQ